jgi:hypothetical protein
VHQAQPVSLRPPPLSENSLLPLQRFHLAVYPQQRSGALYAVIDLNRTLVEENGRFPASVMLSLGKRELVTGIKLPDVFATPIKEIGAQRSA